MAVSRKDIYMEVNYCTRLYPLVYIGGSTFNGTVSSDDDILKLILPKLTPFCVPAYTTDCDVNASGPLSSLFTCARLVQYSFFSFSGFGDRPKRLALCDLFRLQLFTHGKVAW